MVLLEGNNSLLHTRTEGASRRATKIDFAGIRVLDLAEILLNAPDAPSAHTKLKRTELPDVDLWLTSQVDVMKLTWIGRVGDAGDEIKRRIRTHHSRGIRPILPYAPVGELGAP